MASNRFVDVKLHVISTGEKNGQRFVKTDSLPTELELYCSQVELQRNIDPVLQIHLFYEPFLGFVDAFEGDSVPFRLDSEKGKLFFLPSPDLYLGEPRVPLALAPSLVHRFYKLTSHNEDPSLFWCVGLTADKKQKAILLDVARLCSLPLPVDQAPSQTSHATAPLYSTTKISKLLVAIPHRANLSPRSPSPDYLSSDDEGPFSSTKATTPSKTKNIASRLKKRLHGYEEEMLDLSPRGQGSVS